MNGTTSDYLPYPKGFATAAIHAGQEPEQWESMAVIPPIVMSSTFKQFGPAQFKVLQQTYLIMLPFKKHFFPEI